MERLDETARSPQNFCRSWVCSLAALNNISQLIRRVNFSIGYSKIKDDLGADNEKVKFKIYIPYVLDIVTIISWLFVVFYAISS
jgi:hypothetical protein